MWALLAVVLMLGAGVERADGVETYFNANCSSVKIVNRNEWGARPPKDTIDLKLPVGKMFLHHTAMAPCFTKADCIKMVRKIQDFHMDDRGWWDIGYHFLIGEDGYAYEGRGWDHQGAQVKHWNEVSFGLSVMGNFMNITPSVAALDTVKGLIACALQKDKLNHQTFTVHGHRDGGQTTCPGTAYYELIQDWPHYGGPLKASGSDVIPQTQKTYFNVNCSSVNIVSRKEWGARPSKGNTDLELPVGKMFLHHTAMAPCFTKADCIKMVRKIQDFHMDDRGWWDIGYHYLIGEDGNAYEGRGWDHQGAQVKHLNTVSFGISVMGNFMNITPNAAALDTVKGLIACALEKGKLDYKNFTVYGHRDGGQTECPGTAYYELIQDWPHYASPLYESGTDVIRQKPIIVVALVILVAFATFNPTS